MWSQVKIEMGFSLQAVDILVAEKGELLPEYFSSSWRSASFRLMKRDDVMQSFSFWPRNLIFLTWGSFWARATCLFIQIKKFRRMQIFALILSTTARTGGANPSSSQLVACTVCCGRWRYLLALPPPQRRASSIPFQSTLLWLGLDTKHWWYLVIFGLK